MPLAQSFGIGERVWGPDPWAPLVDHGPHTTALAPSAMGRIRLGGDYAQLTEPEYVAMRQALQDVSGVRTRN